MNIDWQEIKEKYPRGLNTFMDFYTGSYIDNPENEDICYCDIEKFFDEQGIIITIDFLSYMQKGKYSFTISNEKELLYLREIMFYNRNETKESAILKAFEILNQQLENKE